MPFVHRSTVVVAILLATASLNSVAEAQWGDGRDGEPDPRGDLTSTLVGSLGGAVVAGGVVVGAFAVMNAICEGEDESDCKISLGPIFMSPALLSAPVLISAGVSLGGDATGGNGTFGSTFLGFAGLLPGILVFSVAAATNDSPGLVGLGVALLPIGYITGAVIGYRWSADDRPTTPSASVALMPLRDGAMFSLSGGF